MAAPGNDFVDKTYGEAIELIAGRFPDREALVTPTERYTFAQVKQHVDRASARLAELGLVPGDRVALWLPNRQEFIWYWLGACQIGLVTVVLNTRLKLPEVAYQLAQSESSAVIVPGAGSFRDFLSELTELCPELKNRPSGKLGSKEFPHLRFVIACDKPAVELPGIVDWSAPAPEIQAPLALARDPNTPVLISYSSGTTALPKGALITHCVWRKAYDIGERADLTAEDRLYLCIPLFGSMAMINGVLPLWTRGAAIVLDERFEAARFLRVVEAERCTAVHLLPPMIEALAASPERTNFKLQLRIGWVLSSDLAVLETVAHTLGIPGVMTGYGLTETATVLTRNRWDDPLDVRINTQGWALPDIELQLVDPETGKVVAANDVGEIWARGYCIAPGYYKKPEETARSITPDGWFRTGDLGVMDETGRLAFRGRLGDGYKCRGFNVSPSEVEAVLATHPQVRFAAVVGVPHPRWGAVGAAFVVSRGEVAPDSQAIMDFLKARLSTYKLPEFVIFVSELPLTAGTGKVQKFRLREQALAYLQQHQAAAS